MPDENLNKIEQYVLRKFKTSQGLPYVQIRKEDEVNILPADSSEFGNFINRIFLEEGQLPQPNLISRIQGAFVTQASSSHDVEDVYIRLARTYEGMEIDLNNDRNECISIAPDGWSIRQPTVHFFRPKEMKALPYPIETNNDWSIFNEHITVSQAQDLIVMISFMLACFKPEGPYPLLALQGEQGSAKSTTSSMIKRMIDPSGGERRGLPSSSENLFIATLNNHLLYFDNISRVTNSISDSLCQLCTGGAFATRRHYTNGEEFVIERSRPILTNGITEFLNRPDLLDRSFIITLPVLVERHTERQVWEAYSEDQPEMLGVLMNGIVSAFRNEHESFRGELPRMADMATWCMAAAEGIGLEPDEVREALLGNQRKSTEEMLSLDPLAIALRNFLSCCSVSQWQGTASNLLEELESYKPYMEGGSRIWPSNASYLSQQLTRLSPNLRKVGVKIERAHRTANERGIIIKKLENFISYGDNSSARSNSSHTQNPAFLSNNRSNDRYVGNDANSTSFSIFDDDD